MGAFDTMNAETKTGWNVRCPEITCVVLGRWWRICLGVTFKRAPIVRRSLGCGYWLRALRLWPISPGDYRIVLLQTKRADKHNRRLRFRW